MSRRKGIMVVDDSREALKLLTDTLVHEGYTVRPTNSGEHALAAVAAEPPELILLDIRMPVLDGFEVCRRLKSQEASRDIPILFLSAGTEPEERVKCFEMGGVDFIPKPFQRGEFLARVRTHLELARLQTRLEGLVDQRTAELHAANEQLQRELSERKRAEETLRQSEASLARAQAIAHLGSWGWDLDSDRVDWSDETARIYGIQREAFDGRLQSFVALTHADDRSILEEGLARARKGSATDPFEFRVIRNDQRVRVVQVHCADVRRDSDGRPACLVGTLQDITDHRELESKLLQAQKMEAIGQLAGGVAHDFNNILMVILGYASLLKSDNSLLADQKRRIEQIIVASEKAVAVTQGLLAFSRKQLMDPKVVDLNQVVQHVKKFLTRIIGEDVRLESLLHPDPLRVKVDVGQMEQVLINLATNSRDAMPEGGVLSIEAGCQEIDPPFVQAHGYGTLGRFAVLTVSDNGIGMDENVKKSMFEPFFTTKEVGKGTGLGMSIVYGIVRQHNGFMHVDSAPGTGSTFRIYLPLVESEAAEEAPVDAPEPPTTGEETVLVVEDDATVRSLLEEVLSASGYQVIMACDGQDAVEKFHSHCDRVALIVMDMIMPKMSGMEAYKRIQQIRPGVRVLYSSGYPRDVIQSRGELDPQAELITKPVQPQELLQKVREMLDR